MGSRFQAGRNLIESSTLKISSRRLLKFALWNLYLGWIIVSITLKKKKTQTLIWLSTTSIQIKATVWVRHPIICTSNKLCIYGVNVWKFMWEPETDSLCWCFCFEELKNQPVLFFRNAAAVKWRLWVCFVSCCVVSFVTHSRKTANESRLSWTQTRHPGAPLLSTIIHCMFLHSRGSENQKFTTFWEVFVLLAPETFIFGTFL